MKICTKCGAHNSDERFFCIDCNEKLGDRLSALDEQQLRENVSENIEKMYNKKEPLYISKFDKVMGVISLFGLICCLVLIVVGLFSSLEFEFLGFGALLFLLAVIEALVPKVPWAFERVRLSLFISDADSAEPSLFYIVCRKASIVILAALGIAALVINFL